MAWRDLGHDILKEFAEAQNRVALKLNDGDLNAVALSPEWKRQCMLAGRCYVCLREQPPERHGRWRCKTCERGHRLAEKTRRERHRRDGKCTHCGGITATTGAAYCPLHAEKSQERANRRKARLAKSGRCRDCGLPKDREGKTPLCKECMKRHLANNRAHRARLVAIGQCTECTAPAEVAATMCAFHLKKQREKFKAWKAKRQAA